jgi:hypothetical protein
MFAALLFGVFLAVMTAGANMVNASPDGAGPDGAPHHNGAVHLTSGPDHPTDSVPTEHVGEHHTCGAESQKSGGLADQGCSRSLKVILPQEVNPRSILIGRDPPVPRPNTI